MFNRIRIEHSRQYKNNNLCKIPNHSWNTQNNMTISKKDRIMLVISVILLLVSITEFMGDDANATPMFWLVIVIAYWSYRFIKNNISFLKIKDTTEE